MADRHTPSEGGEKTPGASTETANFRFTLNVSAAGSGKSSFIEPDPDPEHAENSQSLTDSVQNYPVEFGRTYHAYRAGSYAFPNDLPEQERLTLQNEAIVRLCGGRLFFAPLSTPRYVLDVATGLGEWAIQMGDKFPQAEITATDLSPIQPDEVPPNVTFYVDDSSEPWEYSHNFDYIHARVTVGCWSSYKTQIIEQAFDYLEPGGFFEAHELNPIFFSDDKTLSEDSALSRWFRELGEAARICNRPLDQVPALKQSLREVGFVDVQERVFKMPSNGWPKDEELKALGKMWEDNFSSGLSGFSVSLFSRAFDRSAAETEVRLVDVRKDLSNPRIHAYIPVHIVWGRKPFPEEGSPARRATQ